jgi:hypothetical protein
MHISKFVFVLGTATAVSPGVSETLPGTFILDGVVDWGVVVKITQPPGLTTAPSVRCIIPTSDRYGGGATFQTASIDLIDGGGTAWTYILGETSAPRRMSVVVENRDETETITVGEAFVTYMLVSDVTSSPGVETLPGEGE